MPVSVPSSGLSFDLPDLAMQSQLHHMSGRQQQHSHQSSFPSLMHQQHAAPNSLGTPSSNPAEFNRTPMEALLQSLSSINRGHTAAPAVGESDMSRQDGSKPAHMSQRQALPAIDLAQDRRVYGNSNVAQAAHPGSRLGPDTPSAGYSSGAIPIPEVGASRFVGDTNPGIRERRRSSAGHHDDPTMAQAAAANVFWGTDSANLSSTLIPASNPQPSSRNAPAASLASNSHRDHDAESSHGSEDGKSEAADDKTAQILTCEYPGCGKQFTSRYSHRRHKKQHTGN